MIQGYRMAGPPPHGERPPTPPEDRERKWPAWLGFAALFGFLIAQTVLVIVVVVGFDVNKSDDLPEAAKLSVLAVSTVMFVAVALIAAALIKPLKPGQFGLRRTPPWKALGWSVAAMAVFYVSLIVYASVVTSPDQTTANDLGADESQLALVVVGFLVVVMSPIAEEFFFRAFFYGTLRSSLPVIPAALVTGLVFGGLHASTGADAIPPLAILGFLLCLVYEKTGSLYPCIAIHAFNNMLAYIGQTDVQPALATGMGAVVILGCLLVPRFAWRTS
jgi:membrane protease YdiL (CAAX protease family)